MRSVTLTIAMIIVWIVVVGVAVPGVEATIAGITISAIRSERHIDRR